MKGCNDMMDLVSLGELLVDFTPAGDSQVGFPVYEQNPGGGPANMACAAAKLGVRTAFIGQVGDDNFGRMLADTLRENRVDTTRLRLSPEYQTSLAFVHLDKAGDRSFSFYRRNGADTMLEAQMEDRALIKDSRVFFFSSVMMTGGTSRDASFVLAEHAANCPGTITVFDPNLRLNLWDNAEEARRCILKAMPLAEIVKVSEEELVFLTGIDDLFRAAETLKSRVGMKALLVTLGARGSFALVGRHVIECDPVAAHTIDTTGAGDAFTGGFLSRLLQGDADIDRRSREELTDMLRFANTVGALTTTKRGGIPALPSLEEVMARFSQ